MNVFFFWDFLVIFLELFFQRKKIFFSSHAISRLMQFVGNDKLERVMLRQSLCGKNTQGNVNEVYYN